ncbi:hypothetical protein [Streptomyces sp. NPDC006739]|uniref:hypothetical protein n=1 Tax=Streptomyces sp. NPDC006739 TaxID=3364763 RepID=UPI0036A7E54F
MWPGQQPPGGEQNPQNNPYQQPGYQQPNPYQQPGYQQYQQPAPYGQQPQWGPPAPAGAPEPPKGGGGRTKVVAIVAALAVVVAAGVTGYLVLGGGKDDKAAGGKNGKATGSPSAGADSAGPGSSPSTDNPRGDETEKPTVAGWKTVVNPRWGTAFDVPADWEIDSPGTQVAFVDEKGDGTKPLVTMSAPAEYKSKWCTSDDDKDGHSEDTALAVVGTKGASGAKSAGDAAVREVPWWVYGGYTQPDKKSITYDKKATAYTTKAGVVGAYAWAQSTHTPKKGKCVSDGKAITFGFKNSADDFVTWNLYGAKGVNGEVDKATVMKILSTVRLHGDPTAS